MLLKERFFRVRLLEKIFCQPRINPYFIKALLQRRLRPLEASA